MDPDVFERELRQEGYEVLTKNLEPDGKLPEHEHSWDVKGLVLQGAFIIGTDGRETTYRPGEVFRLPAGARHIERHGPEGARLLLGRRHRPAQS